MQTTEQITLRYAQEDYQEKRGWAKLIILITQTIIWAVTGAIILATWLVKR